jgi:hypothetical protein
VSLQPFCTNNQWYQVGRRLDGHKSNCNGRAQKPVSLQTELPIASMCVRSEVTDGDYEGYGLLGCDGV